MEAAAKQWVYRGNEDPETDALDCSNQIFEYWRTFFLRFWISIKLEFFWKVKHFIFFGSAFGATWDPRSLRVQKLLARK